MGRSADLIENAAGLLASAVYTRPGGGFAFLPTLLAIVYVSSFAHELGHALLGRAAGYVVTSFGLGTGRPWCVVPVGRARAYLGLVRPFQGIAFHCMPHREPSRGAQAAMMAGGIVAHALLAAVGFGLGLAWESPFWMAVALVNGVLGVINLVPLQYRIGKATVRSDGWHLLRVWRSGAPPTPAPMIIQTADAFRPLWTATGDTLALRLHLATAAEAWACLGDLDRAGTWLAESESLPGSDVPGVAAIGEAVRAVVAIEAGRLDEAAGAIDAAEADYRALGHEGGLFLAALLRARARRHAGDPLGACADLAALAGHPAAARRPHRAASVAGEWLLAAVAAGDPEAVASLRDRYERARRDHPSGTADLAVFAALARYDAARGDLAGAASASRRAVESICSLASAWNDPAERARFLEGRAALLDEAHDALTRSGADPGEVDRLVRKAEPPSPAELEARDRRLRRVGYPLLLVNVACVATAFWLVKDRPPTEIGPIVLVPIALALFTAVGVAYLVIDQTIGRFIPALRRSGGAVILAMGSLAWCFAIAALALILFLPG